MELLLYYVVGVVQDFLLTLNWRYVAKDKVVPAAVFSFFVTVLSLLVLYNILTRLDETRSILAIGVYSLGVATGTFLGMRSSFWIKDK